MHHAYAATCRYRRIIVGVTQSARRRWFYEHEVSPPIRKAPGTRLMGTSEWNYAKIEPRLSWKLFFQTSLFLPRLSENFTNHSLPLSLSLSLSLSLTLLCSILDRSISFEGFAAAQFKRLFVIVFRWKKEKETQSFASTQFQITRTVVLVYDDTPS